MLHVSVRAIGWIVDGPDMVLQALLDVLAPAGSLAMYVACEDRTDDWPEWPPECQAACRGECPPFDPAEGGDYFAAIVQDYLASGGGCSGMVGAAQSHLFEAAALHQTALRWIERTFGR